MTDMRSMFNLASSFNQPIDDWNTAAVIFMNSMFNDASSFNQPIGGWNTAAVNFMDHMFYNATSFNQPIGGWNTAAVIDMGSMFGWASSFNQSIGGWALNASGVLATCWTTAAWTASITPAPSSAEQQPPATHGPLPGGAASRQYGTNVVAARTRSRT
ncbi:MAG: DUF285 domain-containing protein [Lewinellaceae bacterium]|nr:DUF285 domain-containing protein [Lewinellaceae bacterium]